ncbi:MAG: BrnA antitoxin family protein [Acidobacteria bacterium]|nr:BrnA antitoxin family protein [Acidobacteriota bacterium]
MPAELAGLYKPVKKPVTLRLDADVLAWFKRQGRGYQTRINRALRRLMMEERKRSGE